MSEPLVTVIVASYNYGRFLRECLDSLLAQSFCDFEILIVDDGSTDGSMETIRDYANRHPQRIRYLTHPGGAHQGLAATYHLGFSNVTGRYAAFLESDDRWLARNLERKIRHLESHPDAGAIFSDFRTVGHWKHCLYWNLYALVNRLQTLSKKPCDISRYFMFRNPVASFSNLVIRKELLPSRPLHPRLKSNLDWWIMAHASLRAPFLYLPEKLWEWRIHDRSLGYHRVSTLKVWKLHRDLMELCRSLLEDLNAAHRPDRGLEKKRKMIARCLKFHESIEKRDWGYVRRAALRHPFRTLRFLSYITLKNLLFQ